LPKKSVAVTPDDSPAVRAEAFDAPDV